MYKLLISLSGKSCFAVFRFSPEKEKKKLNTLLSHPKATTFSRLCFWKYFKIEILKYKAIRFYEVQLEKLCVNPAFSSPSQYCVHFSLLVGYRADVGFIYTLYIPTVYNMQGAKMIVEGGGEFPKTASSLQMVKGIGKYTAGAIASIAFEEVSDVKFPFFII